MFFVDNDVVLAYSKSITEERPAAVVRVNMEERLDAPNCTSHPYRLVIYDLGTATSGCAEITNFIFKTTTDLQQQNCCTFWHY